MNFSSSPEAILIRKRFAHRGHDLMRFMATCDCYVENGVIVDESDLKTVSHTRYEDSRCDWNNNDFECLGIGTALIKSRSLNLNRHLE